MNPVISRSSLLRRRRGSSRRRRGYEDGGKSHEDEPVVGGDVSARRLAAALWRMQHEYESDLFEINSEGPSGNNISKIQNEIFFKLEACAKLPNTDIEKITKWDAHYSSPLNFIKKPSKFSKLTNKSLQNSPLKKHNELYHKIDSIKQNLNLERETRLKTQKINSKLIAELKEAQKSVKKYLKSYEKERKAREQMEEICDDLSKQIEREKDEIETLKIDSLRIRDELEEERRMLQMAEVWREERVQMKLIDAKLTLENKYSELNYLKNKIEAFIRSHNGDVASVRKAQTLIRATRESLNGHINNNNDENRVRVLEGSNELCESSQGSVKSVNGVFKENNWGENKNSNYYKNEGENEISEVCSSVTKQSRNKINNNNNSNNKGSSSGNISKIWGNNGNEKRAGTELQNKKRRSGLRGKIVGVKKDVFNGGIIGQNNGFVF